MNQIHYTSMLTPLLRRAGELILQASHVDSHSKEGTANYVTEYDVAVQNFLIGSLRELFPDAGFIAEEQDNSAAVLAAPHCFIIDPIDGTTNFIHGYRASVISLAMLSHGECVFGAVYQPYTDELFHAEKGHGAFVNDRRIEVSSLPWEHGMIAFSSSPYWKDTLTDANFDFVKELFLKAADIRCTGSAALDLAYLAAGRNDAVMALRLSPWDYAAAGLLIEEAGGVISDMDGNAPSLSRSVPILAANKNLYPELLMLAKKYRNVTNF